jgi:uncharacterized membrane protein YedE/YeeE
MRVGVRIGMGVILGVAGLLALRVSPPPPARGTLLFLGYCGVYYGGFIALAAAVFVVARTLVIWLARRHGDS